MRMMRFGIVAGLLLVATQALAWGPQGHRITGYIANSLLHAQTREKLRAIVGTDDLSQITVWMDEQRSALELRLPHSSRWHYENRLVCGPSANACRDNHCVTAQIERHIQILKRVDATQAQREDAVRILTHLIGDLHQPLHLADNQDRGGNDLMARLPSEAQPRRMHEVWDSVVVRDAVGRRNLNAFARSLTARFASQRERWEGGSTETWARETYEIGQQAYRSLPAFACAGTAGTNRNSITLTPEYLSDASKIAEEQLAKAGVRLAHVLNSTLAGVN